MEKKVITQRFYAVQDITRTRCYHGTREQEREVPAYLKGGAERVRGRIPWQSSLALAGCPLRETSSESKRYYVPAKNISPLKPE